MPNGSGSVLYYTDLKVDDDRTVLLDKFFCDISFDGYLYSRTVWVVMLMIVEIPLFFISCVVFPIVIYETLTNKRCLRRIVNVIGFVNSIILNFWYFFFMFGVLNIIHFMFVLFVKDAGIFADLKKS